MLALSDCGGFGSDGDRFAKKYWNERITDCGSSYVAYDPNPGLTPFSIMECRNPSIWTNSLDLSETDKLNGFEWEGRAGFSCSSMRYRLNTKSGFSNWMPNMKVADSRMWKRNGTWEVEGSKLSVHPDCALAK